MQVGSTDKVSRYRSFGVITLKRRLDRTPRRNQRCCGSHGHYVVVAIQ